MKALGFLGDHVSLHRRSSSTHLPEYLFIGGRGEVSSASLFTSAAAIIFHSCLTVLLPESIFPFIPPASRAHNRPPPLSPRSFHQLRSPPVPSLALQLFLRHLLTSAWFVICIIVVSVCGSAVPRIHVLFILSTERPAGILFYRRPWRHGAMVPWLLRPLIYKTVFFFFFFFFQAFEPANLLVVSGEPWSRMGAFSRREVMTTWNSRQASASIPQMKNSSHTTSPRRSPTRGFPLGLSERSTSTSASHGSSHVRCPPRNPFHSWFHGNTHGELIAARCREVQGGRRWERRSGSSSA